jgi:hypothetical protein
VVWTLAVLGVLALYVSDVLDYAGFHWWPEVLLVPVGGLGVVLLFEAIQGREKGQHRSFGEDIVLKCLPYVLVAGAIAYGLYVGHQSRLHGTVADYCAYGAVSRAQFEGCKDHVSTDDVERLNTDAARFARRELEGCLADSGPFCERALNYRQLGDQDPGSW